MSNPKWEGSNGDYIIDLGIICLRVIRMTRDPSWVAWCRLFDPYGRTLKAKTLKEAKREALLIVEAELKKSLSNTRKALKGAK